MASQITHIYYAQKFLEKAKIKLGDNLGKFYLGNVFPDIRYLANLKRELTHRDDITFSEILVCDSPFQKGMLLHNFIDNQRDDKYNNSEIYNIVPKHKYIKPILKYLEDELTYDSIKNWPVVLSALEDIVLKEEKEIAGIDAVQKWHHLLHQYFSLPPTPESTLPLLVQVRFTDEEFTQVVAILKELRQSAQVLSLMKEIGDSYFE